MWACSADHNWELSQGLGCRFEISLLSLEHKGKSDLKEETVKLDPTQKPEGKKLNCSLWLIQSILATESTNNIYLISPRLRFLNLLTGTFRILCCWCTVVSKERIRQKIYFNELIQKNSVKLKNLTNTSRPSYRAPVRRI